MRMSVPLSPLVPFLHSLREAWISVDRAMTVLIAASNNFSIPVSVFHRLSLDLLNKSLDPDRRVCFVQTTTNGLGSEDPPSSITFLSMTVVLPSL
jgi:hypothetical protein